jgi:MSHA biogenesis protein MshP
VSAPAGTRRKAYPAGQAGFSLVAAVFLIVVLAALAAFAVQVAMSQAQGANMELLQAQAQAAAQTGIEYGANIALQLPAPGTCRANTTLSLKQPGLSGFVVTLGCVRTSHQIGAGPTTYYAYALTSSASHGSYGSTDYVARKVARNVTDAPP